MGALNNPSNALNLAGKKLGGGGPLGGLTGTAGGIGGTGISGPSAANVQQATSIGDVQAAQGNVNNSLAGQQALLAALQGQNGLGQQNAVGAQQNALANQLGAANGIGTQQQAISGLQGVAGQQAATAQQYQNIANGTGPNPAQAALNQSTGQNVANQAALMAGQRGASANSGLIARQAAQQGAATQQQAVGQGATMQAQQQLNALSGLSANQQAQAGTQQAIGGFGTSQLSAQQAQQQAMANQANTVANQQIGGTSANTQANLANTNQQQNALAGVNANNVSSQNNINAANAGIANTTLQGQQKFVGGTLNSLGGAAAGMMASGGEVHRMALGGDPQGPASSFGQFIGNSPMPVGQDADASLMQGKAPLADDSKTPKIPGMGEGAPEGEMMAGPDAAGAGAAAGGGGAAELAPLLLMAAKGGLASTGGHVKAKESSQKAEKNGNSYDNDKIPAKLSEGEIVLPRSVTMSDDPIQASAEFVRNVLSKRKSEPTNKAEGGEIETPDDASEASEAEQPEAPIASSAPPPQAAPMSQAVAPVPAQPGTELTAAPVANPSAAVQTPQAAGDMGSMSIMTPPPAEERAAKRDEKDMAFAQDLSMGKITPKTYSDLYHDKSFTGKVGTLFGLLLSGAGSGLTGQPNALLHMMDRQIEQDLEAQKTNQGNKQNWYRLAMEHEKMQPEVQQKWNEALKSGSAADFERWKNKQAGVDDLSATTTTLNSMRAGTIQSMQNMINMMPPSPKKDAAQWTQDNVTIPHFMNEAKKSNLAVEQKRDLIDAINPPPKGAAKAGSKYEAINQSKLNEMIQKGRFAPDAPGAIPPNVVPEINHEITQLKVNRENLADANEVFNKLANLKGAGQAPIAAGAAGAAGTVLGGLAGLIGGPLAAAAGAGAGKMLSGGAGKNLKDYFERQRDVLTEALKSRIGNNMSEDDKKTLTNSLLPSWTDTPESMEEAHRQLVRHFKSQPAEAAPNLTQYGLKNEAPSYTFKYKKPKEKEDETPKSKADEPKKTSSMPRGFKG